MLQQVKQIYEVHDEWKKYVLLLFRQRFTVLSLPKYRQIVAMYYGDIKELIH
jgi:hypothetical protein